MPTYYRGTDRDVRAGEAGDGGHVIKVHGLVSLRLFDGAGLNTDRLRQPSLQRLLPVRLLLVPLGRFGVTSDFENRFFLNQSFTICLFDP